MITITDNLYLPLSEEQKEQVRPLLMKVKTGGAVFGQLWKDGIHVGLINSETVNKLCELMGSNLNLSILKGDQLCGSAKKAYGLAGKKGEVVMGKYTLDLSEVSELPEHWPAEVRILPIIYGNNGRAFDLDVAAIDSNDHRKLKEAFLKRNEGYIAREDPRLLLPFSMDLSDLPIGTILSPRQ